MFAVFAVAVGMPRISFAYRAFLVSAFAWTPFSLGSEVAVEQSVGEEANRSAQAPANGVLGHHVIEQANALRRAGDAEGAIALLRGYAPPNPILQAIRRMTLAPAYADVKDWESALAQYRDVVEAPSGLPPRIVTAASLAAGHSCLKLGRYEDAVTHLEAWKRGAVEPQPGAYAELSRAYKELGQYALAIENLEAGLRLAEEGKAHTSDQDPMVVMYFRNAIEEMRRLAAEQ